MRAKRSLYKLRFVDTLLDSGLQISCLLFSQRKSQLQVYIFPYIIPRWKHKYKQTFAITCSFIVTNSIQVIRVLPLMNTADSIYVPWFRVPLIWILPSDYLSTDSKQYSTGIRWLSVDWNDFKVQFPSTKNSEAYSDFMERTAQRRVHMACSHVRHRPYHMP